ncbi:MAG: DNA polymerase III subunit delta' [Oscillatoriales cyanobacterium RM2_1_1]|nr:DNA polymerase III subunit delta' [Oscillatoriales cyanobacterium RM2_1_1]
MNSPFTRLIGQPQAVELLTQAVQKQRIAPAYLFVGSPGIGRSLAARCWIELIFRQTQKSNHSSQSLSQRIVDRTHPDLFWVEPTYTYQGKRLSQQELQAAGLKRKSAPQIRLDQIREVSQFLSRSPLEAQRLIVVLEDAETMAESAANGLLKTLEEPGRATLILIAPSPEALLPTLVSRCARIPFYRLSETDLTKVLQRTGSEVVLQRPEILAMAQGSPGQAMIHWQQLQAIATQTPEFLQRLDPLPQTLRSALELGRDISQQFDLEAQLWLVDYLQQQVWQRQPDFDTPIFLHHLEQARQQLRNHVQPRLIWECLFLSLNPLGV